MQMACPGFRKPAVKGSAGYAQYHDEHAHVIQGVFLNPHRSFDDSFGSLFRVDSKSKAFGLFGYTHQHTWRLPCGSFFGYDLFWYFGLQCTSAKGITEKPPGRNL